MTERATRPLSPNVPKNRFGMPIPRDGSLPMRSVHSRRESVSRPASATNLDVLHAATAWMSISDRFVRSVQRCFRPTFRFPSGLTVLAACFLFASIAGTAFGGDLGRDCGLSNASAFASLPGLPYYGPGADPLRCTLSRVDHQPRIDRSSEPVSGIRSWWPGLRRTETLRFGAYDRAAGAFFVRRSAPGLGKRDESRGPFNRADGLTVSPSFTGYERWVAEQLGL